MAKKTVDAKPVAQRPKAPRQRSPNYPSVDLRLLVGKLPGLFEKMKRHAVGVELAVGYMGYSFSSSTGKLALAAMRAFGLFENEKGGVTIKLTTRALDIANDYPRESAEWWVAVKAAALAPNVHAQLWQRYGASLPPDDELRRFLVRELKFNDNSVGDFIEEYKTTIDFAKLDAGDIITGEADGDDDILLPPPPAIQVRVGSLVQWTSNGVDQFPQPRRVVGISSDERWVFVEGSPTGIPMDETFVARGHSELAPPINPHYAPPVAPGPTITFPLPNDNCIEIRLKKPVSEKDFERIKKLVDLSKDSLVSDGDLP